MSASDLVLGKAGGLSTTESINIGLPSLIVSKLPQQEIYNKEFLIKNNCAISVNSKNIANTINQLMKNNKLYKTLKNNTLKIRKPDALDKFYEIISKCKKANYKNLVLTDSKKQLIKNIDKKELGFICLSGIATGASWLCHYYAIQNGVVSVVVPIDKLSILVAIAFSYLVFGEKLSKKSAAGLFVMTVATVVMAIFG
jgi:transporter family protein